MNDPLGAIYKRRLLKVRGREGVKNVRLYLVKRQQRGREGGHKIRKMGQCRLWMALYNKWTLILFSSIVPVQYVKL